MGAYMSSCFLYSYKEIHQMRKDIVDRLHFDD